MPLLRAATCPACLDTVVEYRIGRLPERCGRCRVHRVRVHARECELLATAVWKGLHSPRNAIIVRKTVVKAASAFLDRVAAAPAEERESMTSGRRKEASNKVHAPRKKKQKGGGKRPTRAEKKPFPHEPTHEELVRRVQSPMVGFVCGACGWILIESGRRRRKACPVCAVSPMRTYADASFGPMATTLIREEVAHPDPIGNEANIRSRVAAALERFNQRKNDWAAAEEIAASINPSAPKALVARVYKDIWEKGRPRLRRRQARQRRERDEG